MTCPEHQTVRALWREPFGPACGYLRCTMKADGLGMVAMAAALAPPLWLLQMVYG